MRLHDAARRTKKRDPSKPQKLHANADGTYRLSWPRDPFHWGRKNEKILPDANQIPAKYHDLLDWYRSHDTAPSQESEETDPILALRGFGKDIWRDLGGGEKFIRQMRANWYRVARRRSK